MPVGPLKIAALEGCRDFASTVDRYLVDFRHNSPMHTDPSFPLPGYCADSYLLNLQLPPLRNRRRKRCDPSTPVRGCDLFILVDV